MVFGVDRVMDDLLAETTAIVTGSASGIGRAIARRFADAGSEVVVVDVDPDGGTKTVELIEEDGGAATFVRTDVSERGDVRAMVDTTIEEFGGVDVLVNNAGGSFDDDNLHRVDESTFDRNIEVNLKGSFLCAKEVLPVMVAGGSGSMVHMSSVNGLTGIGLTTYSAAKAGILSLSRLIAVQYGRHGVRSNALCPGTIETEIRRVEMEESGGSAARDEWLEQYALDRFGRPEEVADAALFLSSDLSSFVTGSELVVDGGLTAGLDYSLEQMVYDVDDVPERE